MTIRLPLIDLAEVKDTVQEGDTLTCVRYDCKYTIVGNEYQIEQKNQIGEFFIIDESKDVEDLLEVTRGEIIEGIYYPSKLIPDEDRFLIRLGEQVEYYKEDEVHE